MLDIEDSSGVAVLRMRHGKVNALDLELVRAITEAVRAQDASRALVLTGTGSAFSAGVDLRRLVADGAPYAREFLPALSEAFLAVFDHPGPVVAAVNGHAIAGGCVLAAACDLRLMSAGTIGLAELAVGVPFPTAAVEIMRHAAGPAAGRLVLGAELLEPAQAQAIGLIDHIEEPDELLDAAVRQARRLARVPAEVYALSKRQLRRPAWRRIAANQADDERVTDIWASDDTRKTVADYVESLRTRRPEFS